MNETCMHCSTDTSPCEFSHREHWYARYQCPKCNRRWEIRLTSWTPVQRAAWYRDNILSDRGPFAGQPRPWAENA